MIRSVTAAVAIATGASFPALAAPSAHGTSVAATAVSDCIPSQMRVSHGPVVAGFIVEGRTITATLIFTNVGPTCALWGVPTVHTVVGATHRGIGPFAKNLSMGEMGVRHIVATRGSVTSVYVDAVYFSLATCHPKAVSGLVVSLGSFVKPTYVALAQTTCSGVASSSTRLIN